MTCPWLIFSCASKFLIGWALNADLRGPKPTYNLGAQHTFSSRDAPDPCR
jgi:hypothetical protein